MNAEEIKIRTEAALQQLADDLITAPACDPPYSGLAKTLEHEGFEPLKFGTLEWIVDEELPEGTTFFVINGIEK